MEDRHDLVEIRDYDPEWTNLFSRLAARVKAVVGSDVARVEHVGSTAVPGLAAKPIIDLDVVLSSQSDMVHAIERLGRLGYVHEGDFGVPGREAFRCPPGEQRHHLYLLVEGAAELNRHLAFRDALRSSTALRDEYSRLKRDLAARYLNDRSAYTQAKSAFIETALSHRSQQTARCLGWAIPVLLAAVTAFPIHASAGVICTAVSAVASGRPLRQIGACGRRVTPASTFKIAISLMGYDSGFLIDEHVPALPFQPGYPDWNPSWRATTDPSSWIKNSVVWYSQQVTKSLGDERFQGYVTSFEYGNRDASGDAGQHNGLTHAWLSSSLQISPNEQIRFLEMVVKRELPVSARAYEMTGRITAVAVLPNGWEIHGKTGTGFPTTAAGTLDTDHALGWFVGWATKEQRSVVFARLIQDERSQKVNAGLRARNAFLGELPSILDEDEFVARSR